MTTTQLLKRDLFGSVSALDHSEEPHTRVVLRDTRDARWWLKPLARHLARREARALSALEGTRGVPSLLEHTKFTLTRQWIDGEPMQRARPTSPEYYRLASHLLRTLHSHGVVHNDLAKETNWLVAPSGEPALVDFQLACCTHRHRRGAWFRALAHDDLRHMLKHKRTYLPERLTLREKAILAKPSLVSRVWMRTGKRAYLLITRRVLGWADREGAGDRAPR